MFFVYVLYSPAFDKIYIGFTSDVEKRLASHNFIATKGYTIKYRPWNLVHTETFDIKSDAMRREKELKSARGRAFIRELPLRAQVSRVLDSYPPAGGRGFNLLCCNKSLYSLQQRLFSLENFKLPEQNRIKFSTNLC